MENEMMSTKDAAEELGISVRGVQKMIEEGRLQATRIGRDYIISRESLGNIERKSKAGRPPKNQAKD